MKEESSLRAQKDHKHVCFRIDHGSHGELIRF